MAAWGSPPPPPPPADLARSPPSARALSRALSRPRAGCGEGRGRAQLGRWSVARGNDGALGLTERQRRRQSAAGGPAQRTLSAWGAPGDGAGQRIGARPFPDPHGPSRHRHHHLLVPGQQRPCLAAPAVQPAAVPAPGRGAGGGPVGDAGLVRRGAVRLPVRGVHVQPHAESALHRGPHCRRRGPPLLPLRPVGQQPLLVDLCLLQRLHLSLLLRLGALGERHLLVHPGLLQRPACCLRDPALRVRLRVQEEAPVSRSRAPREVCTTGSTGSEPGGGYAGRGARQRSPLLLSPTDLALDRGSW